MSKNRKQTKINKKLRDARKEADMLRQQWGDLSVENVRLSSEILRIKERLDIAGFAAKTIDQTSHDLHVIKVDIVPHGNLVAGSKDPSEEELEILKKMCVENMVKALLEDNMIQFIRLGTDGPFDYAGMYAAKLYVVPWEQARLRTHFVEVKM